MNEYIKANGINFHYLTQGQGELVLLLHGFPDCCYSWRYQIPELAKNYQVVAPDLRGYNLSDKPPQIQDYNLKNLVEDIRQLILAFGFQKCILIGHDWGGAIAWDFAYQYPEILTKLIVLNIPHPAKFREGLKTWQQLLKSWYIFFFQIPWLPEALISRNNYQILVKMWQKTGGFSQEDLEKYRQAIAQPDALTAMLNYYRCFWRENRTYLKTNWSVLTVPTLMIWGENDLALGKELTYNTEEYVRDFTLKYIPNCSHWVQNEQPQLVNRYLREFLA